MNQNKFVSKLACERPKPVRSHRISKGRWYIKEDNKRECLIRWILLSAPVCPEASGCYNVWTCCLSLNPPCLCRTKPLALFGNMVHKIRWLAAVLDNPDKVNHKKGQIKRVFTGRQEINRWLYTLILGLHSIKNANKLDGMNPDVKTPDVSLFLHPAWTCADASSSRSGKVLIHAHKGWMFQWWPNTRSTIQFYI